MLFCLAHFVPLLFFNESKTASTLTLPCLCTWGVMLTLEVPESLEGSMASLSLVSVEKYSYWLIIMSIMVIVLSLSSDYNMLTNYSTQMLISLSGALIMIVIMVFTVTSPMLFYIMFELSVIPIFMMIMGWGYQPEKLLASISMFLYTLVLASPMIIMVLVMSKTSYTLTMQLTHFHSLSVYLNSSLTLMLITGLLVKIPMYGFHLWLPMAHVEAPVFGSMILAGVLLKLGGYGLYKFLPMISTNNSHLLMISISLMGFIIINTLCIQLTDMKMIVAYSSVSHMAFVIIMASFMTMPSFTYSLLMMLTHAFSSSLLFLTAFYVYNFSHTRNLIVNRGVIYKSSMMVFMWMCATMASMGTPPFINLLSEILCLGTSMVAFKTLMVGMLVGFIMGSAFHIMLFSSITQGISGWENMPNQLSASPLMCVNMMAHTAWLVLTSLMLTLL